MNLIVYCFFTLFYVNTFVVISYLISGIDYNVFESMKIKLNRDE